MSLVDRRKIIIKIIFVSLMLAAVLGYGYLKMRNLIEGPQITVMEPSDGETAATSTISVKGTAQNVAYLYLDDRPIFIDEQGNFSEIMALLPGYNIISLKGTDKFGKKTEKTIRLVLK